MIKALEKQENESNRGQHDDIGRHVDHPDLVMKSELDSLKQLKKLRWGMS